jgi:uncharacterized protein YdeI (YjbR/CyaY-like superfamily)
MASEEAATFQEVRGKVKTLYAPSAGAWRNWLASNHIKEKNIWLIIYRKESKTKSVYYPEAVDEALCFGWVDSKPNKRDSESYYQFFAKRNPKSNWSKINKEKVERLFKANKMAAAGMEMISIAKANGTWNALDEVEELVIPPDLKKALKTIPIALTNFEAFPKSVKRGILEWILNAKLPETRMKRVTETATLAAKNERANQYRKN